MMFEIRFKNTTLGETRFESADPPMGFVFGEMTPTSHYLSDYDYQNLDVYLANTNKKVACKDVVIEDYSHEFGKQAIEVTALLESWQEFDKFFKHHREIYNQLY